MVYQFDEENKGLKTANEHLKEMNELFERKMKEATEMADKASEELQKNKNNFDNIDSIIEEKDEQITRFKGLYKEAEKKMYEFQLEAQGLQNRQRLQLAHIEELEDKNTKMAADIDQLAKKIVETEINFEGEHKKNEELFMLLKEAEGKCEELEVRQLTSLQAQLNSADLKIAKLEEDAVLAKKAKEFAASIHEKESIRKNEEIKMYQERLKVANADLKHAIGDESKGKKQRLSLNARNTDLDDKIKFLEETLKIRDTKIEHLNQTIKAQKEVELRYKDKHQELEIEVQRIGIQKDKLEQTKDENIKWLKKELDVHQSAALKAIERNCMMGEDFRSQALNNKHIIEDLRNEIANLNIEPEKLKHDILKLKTMYKRKIRNFEMQNVDHQMTFTDMHSKMAYKESIIRELDKELNSQNRVLLVLQRKFGRELILED